MSEILKKQKSESQSKTLSQLSKVFLASFENNLSFREFLVLVFPYSRIPSWVGEIKTNALDFKQQIVFNELKEFKNLKNMYYRYLFNRLFFVIILVLV